MQGKNEIKKLNSCCHVTLQIEIFHTMYNIRHITTTKTIMYESIYRDFVPWTNVHTYLICVLRGQARHEAKEIILFPSSSSLSNKGRRLEKLPIGIRYSSISNWPIQFVWGPNRSRQELSAAYCEERSPGLWKRNKNKSEILSSKQHTWEHCTVHHYTKNKSSPIYIVRIVVANSGRPVNKCHIVRENICYRL